MTKNSVFHRFAHVGPFYGSLFSKSSVMYVSEVLSKYWMFKKWPQSMVVKRFKKSETNTHGYWDVVEKRSPKPGKKGVMSIANVSIF